MRDEATIDAQAIVTILSSEGLRIITISRAPGHQGVGTTAERCSVTHARSASGVVVCRGSDPGVATPPRYGNRCTVVVRTNAPVSAAYSASPKMAVTPSGPWSRRYT
jgi:hypothetical protein